jgi:hypothetical protein
MQGSFPTLAARRAPYECRGQSTPTRQWENISFVFHLKRGGEQLFYFFSPFILLVEKFVKYFPIFFFGTQSARRKERFLLEAGARLE